MDFDKINYKKINRTTLKKALFDSEENAPLKKVIKELLKKIYAVRSAFVHHGKKKKIDLNDLKKTANLYIYINY